MVEKNNLRDLLKNNRGLVDKSIPDCKHRDRFLAKLNKANVSSVNTSKVNKPYNWFKYAAVAVLLISVGFVMFKSTLIEKINVVKIENDFPKEVANATFHFEGLIKKELQKIELERNEETNLVIDEAFKQLRALEKEQRNLQEQIKRNYDKRLVKALISNLQYKIQLLENVMQQIDLIKEINNRNRGVI